MSITKSSTREEISRMITKDVSRVFSEQLKIVKNNSLIDTGRLKSVLENNRVVLSSSGGDFESVNKVPVYIRFLDMKKFGNNRIYNAVVYGIIGSGLFRKIKYGVLRDQVRTMAMDLVKGLK